MHPQQISLSEASSHLSCKDKRTVEAWCKSKGIPVFCERKRKYIYRTAFSFELEKEEIESFKIQYPNNWKEIYNLCKEGKTIEAYELTNMGSKTSNTDIYDSYKPQSEESKKFLEKYLNK